MSFNSKKIEAGQSVGVIADIELDKCIHASRLNTGDINVTSSLAIGALGVIAITGGTATNFTNSTPFLKWDDEIIKVTVDSAIQLTVIARGQYGTADVAHSASVARVVHGGDADGSCLGFPDGCTSGDSYDEDTKFLFRFPETQLAHSEMFFNGFKKVTHSSCEVKPAESMGSRANVSLTLVDDGNDQDIYIPYPERRTSSGTLFTKLLARHPNFEGRPMKIHHGFDLLNLDFDNFITREYIIDSVQLNSGLLTIKGVDPLMLTEEVKAKAPLVSRGTSIVAITNASTSITYANDVALKYGAVSSSTLVRIDNELIRCTVASDFVLTITARAVGRSEQKDHDINASVQQCVEFVDVNVVTIIDTLLRTFTDIPTRFFDDYTSVIAATSVTTLSTIISKPISIKKLIDELIVNGDLTMYYDEENQLIKIKPVNEQNVQSITINEEDHIEADSMKVTRDTKNQHTRFLTAWASYDATKNKGEDDFSILYQSLNLDNELPRKLGKVNEKKTFYNRWLTNSSSDVTKGTSIAQRTIDRVVETPEIFEFVVDIENVFDTQGGQLELGSIVNITSSRSVNVDGSPKSKAHQVLKMQDVGDMKYRLKTKLFQDPLQSVNVDFTISENKTDYDLSTEFAPTAGNYVVYILAGVVIGGVTAGSQAFTTGTQNAGVTFDFIVRGTIEGRGGRGGNGGIVNAPAGNQGRFEDIGDDGIVGDDAFVATVDCSINVGSGAILAGGGGASGDVSVSHSDIGSNPGNGGSSGQGFTSDAGGNAGHAIAENVDNLFGLAGAVGSRLSAGTLANVSGGSWGESGESQGGATGGLSGFAIVSNGNSVTITAGDNAINIKGRRS